MMMLDNRPPKEEIMPCQNDAIYFSKRAQEEAAKVRKARDRGDHPVAAVHSELAVRYQAKSFVLQRQ